MESAMQVLSLERAEEDITRKYFTACEEGLSLGELVRHEDFSLRDSVAALEIMDPKMDSGLQDIGVSAVSTVYDCSKPLPGEEILLIIDRLFASEIAWHQGYSLLQTLYTCTYFEQILADAQHTEALTLSRSIEMEEVPRRLLDDVLCPYVASTIKCTIYARDEFQRAHLYEEEDIVVNDFGLMLSMNMDNLAVISHLEEGRKWLCTMQKEHPEQAALYRQLELRLCLRVTFQTMLMHLDTPGPWTSQVDLLLLLRQEIVPSTSDPSDVAAIFNIRVQQLLISTSPPREMKCIPIIEAFSGFESLLAGFRKVSDNFTKVELSPPNLVSLINNISREAILPQPLVRACVKNLALDLMGMNEFSPETKWTFLFTAITDAGISASNLYTAHHILSEARPDALPKEFLPLRERIEQTLEQMSLSYNLYLEALCDNPCRQRRNLCKLLLSLDHLEGICQGCDNALREFLTKQLSSTATVSKIDTLALWVRSIKFEVATAILLLGFETELYRQHEFRLIYWVYRNLAKLTLKDLKLGYQPNERMQARIAYMRSIAHLCNAYMAYLSALEGLGILKRPRLAFTSEELLFRHRLQVFTTVPGIGLLSFEAYETSSRFNLSSPPALLDLALQYFEHARDGFATLSKQGPPQELKEVPALKEQFEVDNKELVRVCIHHKLGIGSLKKQDLSSLSDKKIAWDHTNGHRHFQKFSIV